MILFLFFSMVLLLAGYLDFTRLKIPNALSITLVGLFVLRWLLGSVAEPLHQHLLAMAVAFAVLFPLFALNMLGGGDVKLLTALALWVGWQALLPLFILVALLGGLVTGLILLLRWPFRHFAQRKGFPAALRRGAPIPYGIPIGLAAWIIQAAVSNHGSLGSL